MKMPGVYVLEAGALSLFGRSVDGVHLGLLATTSISTVLAFFLGRRLFDARVGVATAAAFATLTLNPHLLGLAAYAEHFVVLFVLLGTLLLVEALDRDRAALVALSGLLFGCAFLVKQSGGVFAVFAFASILHRRLIARERDPARGVREAIAFSLAAVVPFGVVALFLLGTGTFGNFWFWTFQYAAQYGAAEPARVALRNLRRSSAQFLPASWPIVAGAIVTLPLLWRDRELARRRAFLVFFIVCSVLAVMSAGFYFRQHYFLLMTPAIAVLAGAAPFALARWVTPARARVAIVLVVAFVLVGPINELVVERTLLLAASPLSFSREIYGRNPFPESVEIARYIDRHSSENDAIAVIGSEPQIYFYARRPAATGYIYMYPLMEEQPYARAMQRHMIGELEAARPKYLVFVNVKTSWLLKPASDNTLARWFQDYWTHFERVGVVDIVSPTVTRYRWDDAARDYTPESTLWLAVFRRKD
jgi:dolichyl-phosphate-mannose-protein mannosyltransferase